MSQAIVEKPKAVTTQEQDLRDIACPFCVSERTSIMSLFGGNAGEILMHCSACGTAFHWIKWQGKLPPHP